MVGVGGIIYNVPWVYSTFQWVGKKFVPDKRLDWIIPRAVYRVVYPKRL